MKIEGTRNEHIKIQTASWKELNTAKRYIQKEIPLDDHKAPSLAETSSCVERANMLLFKNNTHLKFTINEETENVIVKIMDDETGEVLKEIPDEDFVEMMHKLCEIAGVFIDERC